MRLGCELIHQQKSASQACDISNLCALLFGFIHCLEKYSNIQVTLKHSALLLHTWFCCENSRTYSVFAMLTTSYYFAKLQVMLTRETPFQMLVFFHLVRLFSLCINNVMEDFSGSKIFHA